MNTTVVKRAALVLAAAASLAVLLGGCVTSSYAGQDNEPSAAVAGETPATSAGTAQADQAGRWERHRFFDVWEIGYPNGWMVDRPGNGQVVLNGAYEGREYQVAVARPTDVQAKDLPTWVQSDLESINQGGAPRQEVSLKNLAALKVTNLKLPEQVQGACPAVRMYVRTDKTRGEQNYLVLTISQTDAGTCDAAAVERLAGALIAEVGI